MSIPKPGTPVRGSQTGSPIMALFDLLGRRWAMGIIWQLSHGPATFRMLQSLCESISPAVLNTRLKDLREARLVVRTPDGYELSDMGRELYALLKPFKSWALDWAMHVAPEDAPLWQERRQRNQKKEGGEQSDENRPEEGMTTAKMPPAAGRG